ncbi:MAG: hypothetical protein FWE05_04465 [Defluviitaleaceae bacterium]|nr:hypothetical protein [Defluviitaleaceae bacterium]
MKKSVIGLMISMVMLFTAITPLHANAASNGRIIDVNGIVFEITGEPNLSRSGQNDQFTFRTVSPVNNPDVDRADVIRALDTLTSELTGANGIAPRSARWLHDSRTQNFGDGAFEVVFSDTSSRDRGFTTVTIFYDGWSRAMWTGFNPWTMDRLELNDFVTFNGMAVSASIGNGGGSVSGSGTARTVEMRSGENNAWIIQNFYSNLQATSNVGLFSVNKRTEGVFRTAGRNHFVNTNDSVNFGL